MATLLDNFGPQPRTSGNYAKASQMMTFTVKRHNNTASAIGEHLGRKRLRSKFCPHVCWDGVGLMRDLTGSCVVGWHSNFWPYFVWVEQGCGRVDMATRSACVEFRDVRGRGVSVQNFGHILF